MTLFEIEKRNERIINSALRWAEGCKETLYQEDIYIISGYLNMNLPRCFDNFIETSSINNCKAYGAHKTIMKTLDKIKTKILKGELNIIY